MTHISCDRCKRAIPDVVGDPALVTVKDDSERSFDLCWECVRDLFEWLRLGVTHEPDEAAAC